MLVLATGGKHTAHHGQGQTGQESEKQHAGQNSSMNWCLEMLGETSQEADKATV